MDSNNKFFIIFTAKLPFPKIKVFISSLVCIISLGTNEYFSKRKLKDKAFLSGNTAGELAKNKTGDIICEVDGLSDIKIGVECKFDKSIKLGDIESKDIFTRKSDTAWSQLIETNANRNSKVSIIVFDISVVDNSILKFCDNVGYIPEIGFVAIINSQAGDYTNLGIAYMLARDIAIKSKNVDLDKDLLAILVNRIIKDINEIIKIKILVQQNIDTNKEILKQIEKSILLAEFNQQYLKDENGGESAFEYVQNNRNKIKKEIVEMIDSVLANIDDDKNIEVVKQKVNATMSKYPLFAW